eukprot:362077-Chlamydomonas_euryale.AAC.10
MRCHFMRGGTRTRMVRSVSSAGWGSLAAQSQYGQLSVSAASLYTLRPNWNSNCSAMRIAARRIESSSCST